MLLDSRVEKGVNKRERLSKHGGHCFYSQVSRFLLWPFPPRIAIIFHLVTSCPQFLLFSYIKGGNKARESSLNIVLELRVFLLPGSTIFGSLRNLLFFVLYANWETETMLGSMRKWQIALVISCNFRVWQTNIFLIDTLNTFKLHFFLFLGGGRRFKQFNMFGTNSCRGEKKKK